MMYQTYCMYVKGATLCSNTFPVHKNVFLNQLGGKYGVKLHSFKDINTQAFSL